MAAKSSPTLLNDSQRRLIDENVLLTHSGMHYSMSRLSIANSYLRAVLTIFSGSLVLFFSSVGDRPVINSAKKARLIMVSSLHEILH